jgi:hypothetical protein
VLEFLVRAKWRHQFDGKQLACSLVDACVEGATDASNAHGPTRGGEPHRSSYDSVCRSAGLLAMHSKPSFFVIGRAASTKVHSAASYAFEAFFGIEAENRGVESAQSKRYGLQYRPELTSPRRQSRD